MDFDTSYYQFLQDAQEAAKIYDYEEAWALLNEAKDISTTRIDAYAEGHICCI